MYATGYADGSGQIRNPSAGGYSTANMNTAAIGSHLSRISRQISDGQGSTSASGSAGRSWGESDLSDGRHGTAKNSKSSHGSSTSDGKSRSRSRGRAHDGLMMASRKRAHAASRKGARLGGAVHANVSQVHDQQGTQGQVQARGSRNLSHGKLCHHASCRQMLIVPSASRAVRGAKF
ncbi:hypothetical protein BDP27DRAFT_159579 [Rhodocollybia butyracea]|uniref:Uncharacterized protein n=1 Tax=Rhodocollybia butyracea TaxID=206335 RepID=A0A9P5PIH9_9AGAR|nr:hypothetical protein BDP27DRAFT_159579 [Rhodocollybia butyracea]